MKKDLNDMGQITEDNLEEKLQETLDNPMVAAMAKNPLGRKLLMKQAVKMLKQVNPDMSKEAEEAIHAAAEEGSMEALEEALVAAGIFKEDPQTEETD